MGPGFSKDVSQDIAYYDRIAPEYFDRWSQPIQRYMARVEARWLRRLLRGQSKPRVLLAGAGGARELEPLLSLGAHVHAVDYSREMIRVGRSRWGESAHWVHGDVHDLSGLPEEFDAVVSLAALNYFADLPRAIASMASRLRPGGTLVISSLNAEHATERDFRPGKITRRLYAVEELVAVVEAAGLEVTGVRGLRAVADRIPPARPRLLRAVLAIEPALARALGPRRCKWIWVIATRSS